MLNKEKVEQLIVELKKNKSLWKRLISSKDTDLSLEVLALAINIIAPNDELSALIKSIAQELRNVQENYLAIIKTPVELSIDQINTIQSFLQEKYNPQLAIQVQLDPTITGGLILQFQGKEIDLSLNNQLTQIFNA